jgi:hypothetical protein
MSRVCKYTSQVVVSIHSSVLIYECLEELNTIIQIMARVGVYVNNRIQEIHDICEDCSVNYMQIICIIICTLYDMLSRDKPDFGRARRKFLEVQQLSFSRSVQRDSENL